MSIIGKFFARIRREKFAANITREIYHKIFPHLNGHADQGYSFSSDDELVKSHLKGFYEMSKTIQQINLAAGRMPKAEGDAFRHVVARDINEQLRLYLKYANTRNSPCCNSQELQPAVAVA
jgi:hypothetical protein